MHVWDIIAAIVLLLSVAKGWRTGGPGVLGRLIGVVVSVAVAALVLGLVGLLLGHFQVREQLEGAYSFRPLTGLVGKIWSWVQGVL